MKKIWILAALMCGTILHAQTTTTYTGTIKDLTGAVVTSGRITFTLNAPSGGVIPGTGSFTATTVSCLINSSGAPVSSSDGVSPCVITNNSSLTPTGTSYTVCRQPYNVSPGSCFVTYANGGTVDMSTLVPTPTTGPFNYAGTPGPPGPAGPPGGSLSYPGVTSDGSNGLAVTGKVTGAIQDKGGQVFNVIAYGATGNGTTDDQTAINAACTAAKTYSSPGVVYFPKPTAFYLTSTLTACTGVSLQGQPSIGNVPSVGSAGVVIRGKPSQDILHWPDPTTTSGSAPPASWSIRDLVLQNDDSVDASSSFPHRWPGRWFNDATMTSGSPILVTSNGSVSCGDVGQNIQVNGAGLSGGNLITTIASVSPCSGHLAKTITLAASPSTSVSNAAAYITPMGISLTQHIGNCAIGMDDKDGNPSDWVMLGTVSNNAVTLRDVTITSTSGATNGQNNSCGIYTQGVWGMYNLDARNTLIARETWGIVQGCSELNSVDQSCANDFQLWDHASWNLEQYPWISYNGGQGTFKAIEITANNGPQLLSLNNTFGDGVFGWDISIPEFEQQGGGAGNYGFRIEGAQNSIRNTNLAATSTQTVYFDSIETTCDQCSSSGPLQINGYQDTFKFNNVLPPSITDNGVGNQATAAYDANPYQGQDNTRFSAQNITRGPIPAGVQSADFIRTGNVSTPYFNDLDLFIWPDDIAIGGPSTYTVADSTSLTGKYYPFGNFGTVSHFQNLKLNNGRATNSANQLLISNAPAGGNVPATNVIVYASLKCLAGSTATIGVYANSTLINSASGSCNSSTYSTISVTANLSSYAGQALGIQLYGSGNFEVAWMAVRPFQADFNGYQPANELLASLTTTASTSDNVTLTGMTSSGHCHLQATNASAATNVATTYVSAKTTNQITVSHTATASMTYDVSCTPN